MSGSSDPRDLQAGFCTLTDDDVSEIRAMEARHKDQAASQDFDTMAEDMAEDCVVWPPNQPEVVGRSQRREWQRGWERISFDTYELPVEEIIGCGDLAFVKGSYVMAFTPEGMDEQISDSGRWIHLLRKTPDGKWLVVRDMFHSDQPLQTG